MMEQDVQVQNDVVITVDVVQAVIRRMASWKAPGPDGVRGFWFKKLTSLHGHLTDALKVSPERKNASVDAQREDSSDSEGPGKGQSSFKLSADHVFTVNVETAHWNLCRTDL